jgi:lipopolysaccharide biosynthesis glycosyltransferase
LFDENCINAVVVCDDNYAQHATVMLRSLFTANAKFFFRIFCLVPQDFVNRHKMEESLQDFNHHALSFITVEPDDFTYLKVSMHISSASYFRLRLDVLLPPEIQRVIYLDCDLIVKDEITSLWKMDLEGRAVAAAVDTFVNNNQAVRRRLGFNPGKYYLNAGVLLIDINQWKEERIGARALEFCLAHPEKITYHDQDAINHIVNGNFKILEARWNMQTSIVASNGAWKCTPESMAQLDAAAIIHFTGVMKPWHYRCLHPRRDLYWAYLKQTAWHGYCAPDRTPTNVIKNILDRYAPFVGKTYRRMRRIVIADLGPYELSP